MPPRWLLPWIAPATLVVVVIVRATSTVLGVALLGALVVGLVIHLRLRYLRMHPPNPELVHKPFWRF